MKLLATGAGLAVILLICIGCKTTKQTSRQLKEEYSRKQETSIQATMSRKLETEYLGDSLKGRMPLPFTVPRSVSYQLESGGITLDITLSDSTITYQSVAKPVARSRLSQADTTFSLDKVKEDLARIEEESTYKKKLGIPWWIWPILILMIFLAVLNKLNRIKLF
jgi:hypothetical protein